MLTDAQIAFLRADPDAAGVIRFFATNGWATATNDDIRKIFANWSQYPAFIAEHGTLASYLAKRGYGSGVPAGGTPGSGSVTIPNVTATTMQKIEGWVKKNPIPAVLAAAVLGKMFFSGRRW